MHVLWTPSWYPSPEFPLNGHFFEEAIEVLQEHGHEVGVYYLNPKSFWQQGNRQLQIDRDKRVIRQTVKTVPLGILPGDYALIKRHAIEAAQVYAKRWGKPDIIHAQSVFPGILTAKVMAAYWDIPFGITEHRGSTLDANEDYPRFQAIKRAVQDADFRLAVSSNFAKELGGKYGAEFGVGTLPVPQLFYDHPLHKRIPGKTRFVHISSLDRWKRVEETIVGLEDLLNEGYDASLDIIGGSEHRCDEVRAFIKKIGIANAVNVLGQVSRDELPSVLSTKDVLVLVSSSETAGMVFAEAQALGIPVIASASLGGAHMVQEETGILVPIDDHDALVDAMRDFVTGRVIKEPEEVRRVAYERFSGDAYAKLHADVYEQALCAYEEMES
ncbi:MAG: glycosyltransferase family 4 protein [Actinomyces sp.]|nr:glycosyltransferase family 4 protein [Actinomyces sp.]